MKDKKIYLGVGLAFLLLMTISLSYAYFSASVSGNDNAKDVVVNAGTLSLVYTDGPEIKVENIRPGKTITKEVTVKNTGTLDTKYNIIWQSLVNEITNDELVLSATCERLNVSGTVEGTCESISQAPKEIYTDINDTRDTAKDLTRTLDYYTSIGVTTSSYSGAIKKNGTSASIWRLRTALSIVDSLFFVVDDKGYWGTTGTNYSIGVAPVFRLG